MKRVIVINTDNTYEVLEVDATLAFLQGKVGGWIEAADFDGGTIFVNEEGKLIGLEPNALASNLWWNRNPASLASHLNGTAVVMGPVDSEGDTTSVTQDTVDMVTTLAEMMATPR